VKLRVKSGLPIKLSGDARRVDLSDLDNALLPEASKTWKPVPHRSFVEAVIDAIFDRNLAIRETLHSLGQSSLRYFGVLDVRSRNHTPDHSWAVALVNENDRTVGPMMFLGCRLFGSNVLAFIDEVDLLALAPEDDLDRIRGIADAAIEKLWSQWGVLDQRLQAYRECTIDDRDMHHITISAFDKGIIATNDIPSILDTWRNPPDHAYESRTLWSCFNAILVAISELKAFDLIASTTKLTKLMDSYCSFKPIETPFVQGSLI
jgi:hypothetical protein